jgi:2-dehydropantoate 2-reductase
MKTVIVGPGAIGLLLYGLLCKAKEDVWLLDKPGERAGRLKKNGIKIEGLTSMKIPSPKVTSDGLEVADADLWIICVKSYDTKTALKRIGDKLHDGAFVLSLQNGVGNVELLLEDCASRKVLAGITNCGATLLEEGVVRHSGEGETIVGRPDGSLGPELRDIRELFQKAKLPVRISKDINSVLWSKLILNVGINALSALTRLPNGRLLEFEGCRSILKAAITEAVKVAKRKRVKIIYDDPLAKAESVCESTAENVSSMLQDILRKKRTEIDFLNGVIVRQGEALGIKTPVNVLLCDLIKTLESGYAYQVS